MVSMYPEDQYALRALRAGALGYVNKSCGAQELVEAVRQVAQGRRHLTPTVAALLVDTLAAPRQALPHERLSAQERALLVGLAQGLRLAEVAARLGLAERAASIYRARMMEKMRFATPAEVAHYARRHGLLDAG